MSAPMTAAELRTEQIAELVKAGNALARQIPAYGRCRCEKCVRRWPFVRRWRAAVKVVEGRDG